MYGQGLGVARDDAEAARLYRMAADHGHGGAAFKVAEGYEYGIGLEKSRKQARHWYEVAAGRGHFHAAGKLKQFKFWFPF
jgi:TPR repeat protein